MVLPLSATRHGSTPRPQHLFLARAAAPARSQRGTLARAAASIALGVALFAAAPLSGVPLGGASALAAPPAQIKTQVPGYYRLGLGSFEVTALYDGFVDLHVGLLKGMGVEQIQSLLARMFLEHTDGVQTAVNAYLVHTGERLILVDAGSAACFGPTLGQVVANIRAAGYAPEAVDTVLLTHLHPDHVCGLLSADGSVAFPNATVWAAQEDVDYWLSEAVAEAAPEGNRPFFTMARQAVEPYQAAGRFRSFGRNDALLPGVTVVPTPGHTPGHTSYLFDSGGQKLLVWGDVVHSHSVQFRHPEVALEFDTDQDAAISTRRAVFARAVEEGWRIAGAHLPFPGLGRMRAEAEGFAWVPAEFGPIRDSR